MKRKRPGKEKGIVLMLVIWVIAILMVVALSLSYTTRGQTLSTLAFKDRTGAKFLAEAGIQRAIVEICYMNRNGIANGVNPDEDTWRGDGTVYNGALGGGHYNVSIMGETGKLDINMVPEAILENLVAQLGVSDNDAAAIPDSIMDWKDPSGLTRPHGAGDEYYMSLPSPYEAKHANFEALEELLLVKGVTPELLFGTPHEKGLVNFLTVNSKSAAINVNYAPREVLLSLPGISPEMADRIIAFRDAQKIVSPQQLQAMLGAAYTPLSPYLATNDANVFTIESVGFENGGKAGYPIRATVMMNFANDTYKYLYYKSPAYRY